MNGDLMLAFTLLLLLAASGFFSGSETALFSIAPLRLREMKGSADRSARAVAEAMDRPRNILVTILIGNMVVNILASALGTQVAIRLTGSVGVGVAVATIVMTFLLLVAGEIAPKTVAYGHAESIARFVARPLLVLGRILSPLRRPLLWLTDLVLGGERKPDRQLELAEIDSMLRMAHAEGEVETRERDLIRGVFELGSSPVGDVMTPRTEIFALERGVPLPEARARARQSGFSKIPVSGEGPDEVEGVVSALDLLLAPDEASVSDLVREPHYVPEVKPALDLLEHFRASGERLAFVVDEHGHLAGLVTLTDLLEEISGEIVERGDLHKVLYQRLGPSRVVVPARMEIRFFNEEFRVELESEESETLGGLVLERTGQIPSTGEELTIEELSFRVLHAEPNRVVTLEVTFPEASEPEEKPA
jgi:putative hemolysin